MDRCTFCEFRNNFSRCLTVPCSSAENRRVEELKKIISVSIGERNIEMAEQQLTGFAHARAGYTISALAEGMGLTEAEWAKIKERGLVYLGASDKDVLDVLLG